MMMKTVCALTVLTFTIASSPSADAQASESQAKAWGLTEEVKTVFSAKVVDIACELGAECPENCGDGLRQLGLLNGDKQLISVAKNGQAQFNGAVVDLLPFCGMDVDVDGLMTGHGGVALFQVQFIREAGGADWQTAKNWTAAWKEANPDFADGKGPWFRRDPRVTSRIEAQGYLGLGLEEDKRFIAEW